MIDNTAVVYRFDIKAESKVHKTTITVDEDRVVTTCSCNTAPGDSACWHAQYVLAGRSRRISKAADYAQQSQLLSTLSKTPAGQQVIQDAQSSFVRRESCRRCHSSNVIIMKKSIWGRVIGFTKPDSHRFYCKACGWSW
ncbi:MAG: hypothetical protein EOP56_04525 [Sphingobacteriales bacterium]|nr:MAG: hypothetical protein EOP56_04525 [Sphingobacteriales bacterium]